MGPILLGAGALLVFLLVVRAFVGANPSALMRGLRYGGIIVLALAAVGLFYIERPAVGAFFASAAWGLYTRGHLWPGGWPRGRGTASSGNTSSVRTTWLEMVLDHDSGEMHGTILRGAQAGRSLGDLDSEALMAFYAEAGSDDAETKRLLEAYFDRTVGPDWHAQAHTAEPPPAAAPSGMMTRTEALKILGLQEGATAEDIRAAHRRLMMQMHPDKGGTDYFASKINEAKDYLLGE